MMKVRDMTRIAQGKAVNVEERMEEMEKATEARLMHLEEAIISLKDILVRVHEENEMLKGRKEAVFEPFLKSGEAFVKSLVEEEEQPKEEVKISMKQQNEDMERAIRMMRQKFGLPAKIGAKIKKGG